jgi:hypothetical protein
MNELVQPVHTLFTERTLRTRPSHKHPDRPKEVVVWYNTGYWDIPTKDPEKEVNMVSGLRVFHSAPSQEFHQIQFNWTPYQPKAPGQSDPLKPAYFQWAEQGKHPRQVVLFYRVCGPHNYTSHRLVAVAASTPETYNLLKNRLVEAYLDWTLTGYLPVIGGSRS